MENPVTEFNKYRSKMNERILGADNLVLKRLFNLDTNTYAGGTIVIPHLRRAVEFWDQLQSQS